MSSYYEKHVFICVNNRSNGKKCCQLSNSQEMLEHTKKVLRMLKISPRKVRVSSTGCMGRCAEGPVMVIYPDCKWYTFKDKEDINKIITEHLVKNNEVSDLQLV